MPMLNPAEPTDPTNPADPANPLPRHVAVIPDGNRRWAKRQGLKLAAGHKAGYDTLKRSAYAAFARGIPYVTAYGFSTENWTRTKEYLMKLAGWVLKHEAKSYHADGIRIRILGSREGLDASLAKAIDRVEELTRPNTGGTISICFNYGGRRDLVEAVQRIVRAGTPAGRINEQTIAAALSSAGLPDPDLIIRTGGEQRLSNFLNWEAAYAELYFSDKLWPDFDTTELDRALASYAVRKRNFGS